MLTKIKRCDTVSLFRKKVNMIELFENKKYKELVEKISRNYTKAQQRAFKAINDELTLSNWETGKYIVEFEQKGNPYFQ